MDNINTFLSFLEREKGQKETTLRTNQKLIKKILRDVHPLTKENFNNYLINLVRNITAHSYIKQQVAVVRQWGECFGIEELQTIKIPKVPYKSSFVRATFADDEILRFLSLPNPHRATNAYWRTKNNNGIYHKRYEMWVIFYTILFYHGMRTLEIARLQVDMFDFGLDTINLPGDITKTAEPRTIPISPEVREKIYDYVNGLQGSFLFPAFHPSSTCPHVQENDWNRFFKNQLVRLNIKRKNLTPYSGRHTYGTRMAEEDVHLSKIKVIMGHKRITTTEQYIHIGLKSLKRVQEDDRLRRKSAKYLKRYLMFREQVRNSLRSYANTPAEERKMLKALLENN